VSDFKGTPGPWEVYEGNVRTENPGRCVARLDWAVRDYIDDENARLIAAAPDLLHALRCLASNAKCLRAFETDMRYSVGNTNYQCLMESVEQADAAIAKALQP